MSAQNILKMCASVFECLRKILKRCISVFECLLFVNRSNNRPKLVLLANEVVDYRGWQALPSDLMGMIVSLLDGTDRVYTSVVCKSWYRILKQNNFPHPPQTPWLLLPHEEIPQTLTFYDLSQAKVQEIKLPRSLGNCWYCCGSSKGWLAMITNDLEMFLLNPLSGKRHQLPSLKTIPAFNTAAYRILEPHRKKLMNVEDIQLSCRDPLKCVVAAIIFSRQVLACCRIRDKAWTIFEGIEGGDEYQRKYELLLFREGMLYATTSEEVNEDSGLKIRARSFKITLDDDDDSKNVTLKLLPRIAQPKGETMTYFFDKFRVIENACISNYLIESDKTEMLAVIKYENKFVQVKDESQEEEEYEEEFIFDVLEEDYDKPSIKYYKTRKFEVFKLIADDDDITGTSFSVQKIESLDEGTLFLSNRGSTSLGSSKEGIGNCIYFADDTACPFPKMSLSASREIGIFYLQNGNIKRPFPSIKPPHQSAMTWFSPNFIL